MPTNDAVQLMMDEAANKATQSLKLLDPKLVKAISDWWLQNYTRAGHKRLGRILIAYGRSGPNGLEHEPWRK